MPDEQTEVISTALQKVVNSESLAKESTELLNQIIAENNVEKAKDLTYLFNLNQNKKTMVRLNKLHELMDVITDQAITRFSEKPDNLSNQELLQGLKVVQEAIERGQSQVRTAAESPLIQINQQTNEVNVGSGVPASKESRDRIKNAVADILAGVQSSVIDSNKVSPAEENEQNE